MTVREAEFSDVAIILELLEEGKDAGSYHEYHIDMNVAKQLVFGTLQRTRVKGDGGTCVLVWDDDGVQGVIVGVTERIYHIAKELRATDVFFYIAQNYNDPEAFKSLLRAFEKWAWSNSRVRKIDLGVTNLFGDPERLARIYERFGYNRSGVMLEKHRPEPF